MKHNYSKKRVLIIVLFLIILCGISLGYSRLLATLSIDGDVSVSEVRFDIRLKNLAVTEGSFLDEGNNTSAIDLSNNKKVSYNVTVSKPGEFYEFTYKIANQGTMAGYLTNLTETGTTIENINLHPEIYYSVEGMPRINDLFNPNDERTIKVRIEYIGEEEAETPFTITKSFEYAFSKNQVSP